MIPEITGDFLQQLRGFYYVATSGSVSDAANQMNRTQSAVTYQIQLLEKELGIILFLRLKNKMILTEEGKHLLTWALRIFDTISGMQEELQGKNQIGYLRISGSRPLFNSREFTQTMLDFHEEWPNVHVSLNSGHPSFIYSGIKNGHNDFGLIGMSNTFDDLDFIPLFQSPFLLAIGRNEAAALPSPITPDVLKSLPYISFSINFREQTLKYHFVPPQIQEYMNNNSVLSCSNYFIIMNYVAMGLGCTIIDKLSFNSFNITDKIHVIDISSMVEPLQYGILLRKKSNISQFKKNFIDRLIGNLKNISFEENIPHFVKKTEETSTPQAEAKASHGKNAC